MTIKYKIGTQFFYSFTDDHDRKIMPDNIRLVKVNKDKSSTYKDEKSGKLIQFTDDQILENYSALKPDGFIVAGVVNVGNFKDVIVALYRYNDAKSNKAPYAVCRNCVYDYFTNMVKKQYDKDTIYVGISISQDTYPAEAGDTFENMLACDSIDGTMQSIAIYVTDNLKTIISLVHNKTKLNNVLRETYQKAAKENPSYKGYETSFIGLLEHNRFMFDFNSCFKIIEMPITLRDNQESLEYNQMLFIEDHIKKNIVNTYVIPYTKDIDLSEIKRSYVLISCIGNAGKIYLVGYDTTGEEYIDRYHKEVVPTEVKSEVSNK